MSKIRRDLGQLSTLSANISGTDGHIDIICCDRLMMSADNDLSMTMTVLPGRRYFGVELSELVSRDGTLVPRLLLQLAQHICTTGY